MVRSCAIRTDTKSKRLWPMNRSVGRWLAMLCLGCVCMAGSADDVSGRIVVTIVGFESDKGQIMVALWDEPDRFPTGEHHVAALRAVIKDGTAQVEFADVAPGEYALSVFHDENDNGELDTGFMGIPREPIGASNDARGRFGPPRFDDARFDVDQSVVELTINLQQL
jgi:uncharacterized protein (DUF2141 family)